MQTDNAPHINHTYSIQSSGKSNIPKFSSWQVQQISSVESKPHLSPLELNVKNKF